MRERTFHAMNTEVRVAISTESDDADELLEPIVQGFRAYERALSRFDPTSELSALNRAAARWTPVSALLYTALKAAEALTVQTDGLYNPAILPALEAAGYDRSFELLPTAGQNARNDIGATRRTYRSAYVRPDKHPYILDPRLQQVRLNPDVRLDLGGIGKGLAVDAAAERLCEQHGFLVDAGGDLYVGGESPDGGPWGVAVQNPDVLDQDIAVLALTNAAVATSSVVRRQWLRGGLPQHHLIDPRTGRSAMSDVRAATVIGTRCAAAEVWAKVVVIAGLEEGFALLDRVGLAGLAIDTAGTVRISGSLRPFLTAADA